MKVTSGSPTLYPRVSWLGRQWMPRTFSVSSPVRLDSSAVADSPRANRNSEEFEIQLCRCISPSASACLVARTSMTPNSVDFAELK